jgi:CheY-like chemotaxis protein
VLEGLGNSVVLAENGCEAVVACEQAVFDVVLMDIQMPVMDGFELVTALKNDPELAAIPAVAVTALAMVGDRDRILAAGFDGYVSKPIDAMTFVGELESFLPTGDRAGRGRP